MLNLLLGLTWAGRCASRQHQTSELMQSACCIIISEHVEMFFGPLCVCLAAEVYV